MIIIIGEKNSKRTDYFIKAALSRGTNVRLITWEELLGISTGSMVDDIFTTYLSCCKGLNPEDFLKERISGILSEKELQEAVIKIEPPSYKIADFSKMSKELSSYLKILNGMEALPCKFLNSPRVIGEVLNKRIVKKKLNEKGICTTGMFMEKVDGFSELLDSMTKKHCYGVFLKPVFFSGAAGVTAFRISLDKKSEREFQKGGKEGKFCAERFKMKLYSSAFLKDKNLFNSKRLFTMENPKEIRDFLEVLFSMDVMAERWYPKDTLKIHEPLIDEISELREAYNDGEKTNKYGQRMGYDLRVVYQFGHIAHIVARLAKGPITNLHLNNHAEKADVLGLSREKITEIEKLCREAVSLFPGLNIAGIDIMLDKGSQRPRIIEINGQGDLIYQDIFGENKIYREQVERIL